ncbi:TRAP transporter 4TM/12TM fusion protein [Constrictibacter sp. MBR-5]|jgi:TRAP transporter 4TM/12TM fusion protein|uniref:TRAP transporter permease n=1 Tax=Constrictibacter sp. MBR-5 TaxID=3156467 RepID=UPI00339B6159
MRADEVKTGGSVAAEPAADTEGGFGGWQRQLSGWQKHLIYWNCIAYTVFHLYVLNVYPIDPWVFRSVHVSWGTALGLAIFAASDGSRRDGIAWYDWLLMAASLGCAAYIAVNLDELLFRVGALPTTGDFIVGLIGTLLVLEITRRTAGLALPIIAVIFILYCFVGPWLPGVLAHRGYDADFFFSYIYSMEGVFGPTTAVSSTYIVLFIAFSAFLDVSKVGGYFINFAFSIAGGLRGGPAKVAVFSSALMGTINGTAAGNVVATGTFTIPLMKKVGYSRTSSGAIEAAASTGGQILPPVMGAGAFIMAEVTGIPYVDIVVAAVIPALLYFIAVFFMVDNEAIQRGLRGLPRSELPDLWEMVRRIYLFLPLIILVGSLVSGYSIVRAGTLGLVAAFVTSWLHREGRMGPRAVADALGLATRNSLQLIAVCACAGIIVGVIGLTGLGGRFSAMIFALAQDNTLLALIFAMLISLLLGMGMPTTAAYAVAASVVAPGLVRLGIPPLTAHMFVFYYAVISTITPPVALSAYAGAAIAGGDAMKTSVVAFKYGLAAFLVPFMFFYSPALLMQGETIVILRVVATALIGVWFLAGAVQGWFFGPMPWLLRGVLLAASLLLIEGGWTTDLAGIGLGVAVLLYQRIRHRDTPKPGHEPRQAATGG